MSRIATVFDPVGFLAPFVITGKVIIQDMWTAAVDWDAEVPKALEAAARAWLNQLPHLDQLRIPRCHFPNINSEVKQLHVFVDASTGAYAAVVYTISMAANNQRCVRFVAAKTRVTPLQAISIPRLEFLAAMLGLQLAQASASTLRLKLSSVVFWSDSEDVLWWIRRPSRQYKPFVAQRVGGIHTQTGPDQWRHVPSRDNPADLASRGVAASKLVTSSLWWVGPAFLQEPPAIWTAGPAKFVPTNIAQPESKREFQQTYSTITQTQQAKPWPLVPERFEKWTRLIRITALLQRFCYNCRVDRKERSFGSLNADELKEAEVYHIRMAQQNSLPYTEVKTQKPMEKASALLQLQPFIDPDGLVRVGGRLQHADFMTYEERCPIVLPKGHAVTQLIVRHCHEEGHHINGVNHTLSLLSTKYWLHGGREEIRKCEANCTACARRKASPGVQVMAPLPKVRVSLPLRAFARISLDYAGPFTTKQGRGKTRAKRYLCLFACNLTQAVHLEMAYSLDTDSFL